MGAGAYNLPPEKDGNFKKAGNVNTNFVHEQLGPAEF